MSCAKCRRVKALDNDTWCIGCNAWEALGVELTSHWHSLPLRSVAGALVVQTVTSVRALRQISSSLQSEADSKASQPSGSRALPTAEELRERDGERQQSATKDTKEEEESSEYESESEEAAPLVTSKSKPPEPPLPPKDWVSSKAIGERGSKRKDRDERQPLRRKKERGRRGGRKHPELHRQLRDPDKKIHRKQGGSFWDSYGSLAGLEPRSYRKEDGRGRK